MLALSRSRAVRRKSESDLAVRRAATVARVARASRFADCLQFPDDDVAATLDDLVERHGFADRSATMREAASGPATCSTMCDATCRAGSSTPITSSTCRRWISTSTTTSVPGSVHQRRVPPVPNRQVRDVAVGVKGFARCGSARRSELRICRPKYACPSDMVRQPS